MFMGLINRAETTLRLQKFYCWQMDTVLNRNIYLHILPVADSMR
jgi:hypothetical protein